MGDDRQPVLRVVRGAPSVDELGAVVTVLLRRARQHAAAAAAAAQPVSPGSQWVRNSRAGATVGARPAYRGSYVWRSSTLPR